MKKKSLILFTHIPKTGGTSIKKSTFYKHAGLAYNYRGLSSFIGEDIEQYDFIDGHYPFGLHYFTKRNCCYFVSLRDPIDCAVSTYYFIKQCNYRDYKHPRLDEVLNQSLVEFWSQKKNHNPQTKAVAGIFYSKMVNILPNFVFKIAKARLVNDYVDFGLLEESEAFSSRICDYFGWTDEYQKDENKKTMDRPSVSEVSDSDRRLLEQSLSLDIKLYDYAKDIILNRP
jgi:hypothetical protein